MGLALPQGACADSPVKHHGPSRASAELLFIPWPQDGVVVWINHVLSVECARCFAAHVTAPMLVETFETHSFRMWMAYPLMLLYPQISMSSIFAGKVEVGVLTVIQTCDNSAGSVDGQSADPFGTCDLD